QYFKGKSLGEVMTCGEVLRFFARGELQRDFLGKVPVSDEHDGRVLVVADGEDVGHGWHLTANYPKRQVVGMRPASTSIAWQRKRRSSTSSGWIRMVKRLRT